MFLKLIKLPFTIIADVDLQVRAQKRYWKTPYRMMTELQAKSNGEMIWD